MRAEHEGYFTAMMQVVFDDVPDNPLARQSVLSIMGTGAFEDKLQVGGWEAERVVAG